MRTACAFFAFLILLFLCWPLALAGVLLLPLVWLLLLPFQLVAMVVGGLFAFLKALLLLPARLLGG